MQLWDIKSELPYSVGGRFQRDHNGLEVWVATLKKRWILDGGIWVEDSECVEILDNPLYLNEPGLSPVISDHDFAIYKKNTDVVIHGKAKTFKKEPCVELICRLFVDKHIDKQIKVVGHREWVVQSGSIIPSMPLRFITSEIDYTCALGGHDERNRLGCGVGENMADLQTQNVPSMFNVDEDWSLNSKKIGVVGFGALPTFFQQRYCLAGSFDDAWINSRRPLLPIDFDTAFYQTSPVDQQCSGFLMGGERISLSGFSHEGVMTFILPKQCYEAKVRYSDDIVNTEIMDLHTLFFDTEKGTVSATFTASFPCQGREHMLISTLINKR
ncbi:DUF2169 family type VI secretion system accessory protein [Moritella viscosa]|uniref:DUF2169 domain-containing protein n=1 Tax=Moritella viscosa TaxID=80854 RepID=A0A1K9ZU38_9GAMM|nr:DUF2169 domain-containing protein [Moritella viscosa]SGY96616.1 Putative uncharacterized protein [Moritella viscosa]SGZ02334.1 Putative uncharacterized protein [Moritella viscosa]SGZ09321.1 Putative uncharacterized protein [Moritella viscosa]SGZ15885.1 Putative uncharacterized protein [Moritella viscosa]SHO10952.1 Putative uncharacterized protein [Moritella viscosa]